MLLGTFWFCLWFVCLRMFLLDSENKTATKQYLFNCSYGELQFIVWRLDCGESNY